jgi:hypothetical protein
MMLLAGVNCPKSTFVAPQLKLATAENKTAASHLSQLIEPLLGDI